jgi:hypothetical protein
MAKIALNIQRWCDYPYIEHLVEKMDSWLRRSRKRTQVCSFRVTQDGSRIWNRIRFKRRSVGTIEREVALI